jgi:DNA-binding transcriptional LysR family regulator
MEYKDINFDWNHAKAFLVTAQEGSLSAGAKALRLAQPTLGRQVAALEQKLGIALFERFGRGLVLTPTGLKLVEHIKVMSDAASLFSLGASAQSDRIEGNVIISATEAMAAFWLPKLLLQLHERYPGIVLEIIASNEASDLRRRQADIAIREFRPVQADLIVKRLMDVKYRLYAAKSYIASLKEPIGLSSVGHDSFIGFGHENKVIKVLNENGMPVTRDNFSILCANHLVQWELLKGGFGIGVMPSNIADSEPLVQRVLYDMEATSAQNWLVAHCEVRSSRRIKVVFEFLAEALGQRNCVFN